MFESSLYSEVVIADKGYDSQALREMVNSRNTKHVIPRKGNSKTGNDDIV
ncbi:transposase [Alteromonas sp. V450]